MIYEFLAEDGSVATVNRSMHDAPEIGEPLELDGKTYYRVYSVPLRTPETRNGSAAFPRFESKQLPRRVRGNDKSDAVYRKFERSGGTFSPEGCPRVSNRKQADEIGKAMSGDGAVNVEYGDL